MFAKCQKRKTNRKGKELFPKTHLLHVKEDLGRLPYRNQHPLISKFHVRERSAQEDAGEWREGRNESRLIPSSAGAPTGLRRSKRSQAAPGGHGAAQVPSRSAAASHLGPLALRSPAGSHDSRAAWRSASAVAAAAAWR